MDKITPEQQSVHREEFPRLSQVGMISFRQLGYLISLADTLNFTKAAKRCFVTQSTLSSGIQELERIFCVRLVERDRKKVWMTDLGLEVVEHAKGLVTSAGDLINLVKDRTQHLSGVIQFGVIPTIAPFMLSPLLSGLAARAPDLKLSIHEDQTATLLQGINDGWLDCALIAQPMDVGRLNVHPLFPEDLWLVAQKGNALLGKKKLTLAQLEQSSLVLLSEGHCLREQTLQACGTGRRGRAPNITSIDAQSLPTMVEMVSAGLGVALLPSMCLAQALHLKSSLSYHALSPAPQRRIVMVSRSSDAREDILAMIANVLVAAKPPPIER